MKRIIYIALLLALAGVCLYSEKYRINNIHTESDEAEGMEEDIAGRTLWEQEMLGDPKTGRIPAGIRQLELSFASSLPVQQEQSASKADYGIWVQRGPDNVGGRTRAIAIDLEDENHLIVGATAGGIWHSLDAGNSWQKISSDTDYIPATCIVQDPRKNKHQTWYIGTGELYGSALPGGYIYGYGIRKSTDNGKTWSRLSGTFSSNPQFDLPFDFVHRIAINSAIDSLDVVFAATFDGIFRSTDGGKTWLRRRGGNVSGASYWSDVAITKDGIVYAVLSAGGNNGVWRSTNNGQTWTNISPAWFGSNMGRVVICLAPSDENQIYFACYSPGIGKQTFNFNGDSEWNSFWKYTYISGDGTGNGGNWEDRSANIPTGFPGDFGQFISQQGYSLHVDVKPDDPNVVFLGGTNLYRSTDGFKTSTNTIQAGGYAIGTVRPDFKTYPNQHPDQHGVIFYKGKPSRAISLNDGGIQRTENCLASVINWDHLNHGYVTTQFYSVAIDHNSTSDIIIGGLQDNGTLHTSKASYTAPWEMIYSYDGSHCYVGPNATEYYISIQEGRVSRLILDTAYKLKQMARLDPKGTDRKKYQFINPFIPDRNEWKRLYIPNGNLLFRNQDVTQIPLHNQIDSNASSIGWEELIGCRLPDSTDEITAITSSLSQNDVILYGTMRGKLFKVYNASGSNPVAIGIGGSNFPSGYINCITTDPTDSNKLYCVFSNYAILSVFYSENGGKNWVAISGNLEEKLDGTGIGPSCRWLTVVPQTDSNMYFLGTSTGLFATKRLNGMSTVWVRQGPKSIGLNVVTMMDYRAIDRTLAISTYGAGVFTSKVTGIDHTGISELNKKFDLEIYPNPATNYFKISHLNEPALCSIIDSKGSLVSKRRINIDESYPLEGIKDGIYIIQIETERKSILKRVVINRISDK